VECQDPEDIEDSTKDPDVVDHWKIEHLTRHHSSVTSARSASKSSR
jgi:hypothetical protein